MDWWLKIYIPWQSHISPSLSYSCRSLGIQTYQNKKERFVDIVSSFVFHLFVCLFVPPENVFWVYFGRETLLAGFAQPEVVDETPVAAPGVPEKELSAVEDQRCLAEKRKMGCCDSFSFLSNRCGEDLILIVMDTKTSTVKTAFCWCFPKTQTEKDSPDVLRGLCCQRRHWLCPDEAPWCFGPLQPGGSWFRFLWFQFLPKFDSLIFWLNSI